MCACISTTLYRLEQKTGKELPRLTNIVFTPESLSQPNNYVVKGPQRLGYTPTWEDYESQLLAPIHASDQWDEVLNSLIITDESN